MKGAWLSLGLLCIIARIAQAGVPTAAHCPAPGIPPGAEVTLVAPRSQVDGLPLLILALHTRMPPAQLLHWYDHRWKGVDRIPQAIVYRAGSWAVVARKTAGCFESVQVKPAAFSSAPDTVAYLGISKSRHLQKTASAEVHFPMPGGSRLLLTMDNSGRVHTRNMLFLAPGSPGATAIFYRHDLAHAGWALQMHQHVPLGHALMFQRKATHAEIALTPYGRRTSVFITITHD
ncbi:MAG: hypothetical protein M0Z50_12340 [Planctomycetia bacterium]|nr:hypothetical protein [Planctomycetia bacterium]